MDLHRAQGRGRRAFWILAAGVILLAVIWSAQGFGHDRAGSRHGRHGFAIAESPEELAAQVDRWLEHLDATGAQRERITALVDELAPELVELTAEGQALRGQIVEALAAEEPSAARIASLQEDVREWSGRLAERAMEITFEIAAELTPEQRAELIERWEKR
jgi:Spy/CpxP family protein refolding chaperone